MTERLHREQVATLTAERDSLQARLQAVEQERDALKAMVREISEGLDPVKTLVQGMKFVTDLSKQVNALTAHQDALHQEVAAYRETGLTEEILRRHNGFIRLGHGYSIVSREEYQKTKADLARCRAALTTLSTLGGGRSDGNAIAQEALKPQQALEKE